MKPPRNRGRFIKGYHYSPETELKKGQHWRKPKPFWQKEWLEKEYVDKKRTANEIAKQFGVTKKAIVYWLNKHNISLKKENIAQEKKSVFYIPYRIPYRVNWYDEWRMD